MIGTFVSLMWTVVFSFTLHDTVMVVTVIGGVTNDFGWAAGCWSIFMSTIYLVK